MPKAESPAILAAYPAGPDDPFEPVEDTDTDEPIAEYEITATPNDFNVSTIFSFIDSGAVVIPGFQRNYVWELKRASKLIESLLIGLPVPQIFLYEDGKNKFLVIDGQQRLMSIYYFIRQRFPRFENRARLRQIFDDKGTIPPEILADDVYFEKFNLRLPSPLPAHPNRFDGLNYDTLGEFRRALDLRPIRNVIVKQQSPRDDSAVYEIFNRLNSGGINLTPQEIRASLYHSAFFDMLRRINADPQWRTFIGVQEPDLHLRDVEFLLRAFALLINGADYQDPMTKFLNQFAKSAKAFSQSRVHELETYFRTFMTAAHHVDARSFRTQTNRFRITIFEALFFAFKDHIDQKRELTTADVTGLTNDKRFGESIQEGSTKKLNVQRRLDVARDILSNAKRSKTDR